MSEPLDINRDPALWRRWRAAEASGEAVPAPDPLLVAAYAEGRLSENAAERVEAWLASDPARLEDVQAARMLRRDSTGLPAPESVLARAKALVDGRRGGVLPFRRSGAPTHSWRSAAAWGSMAASLLVTCLVGFALGSDAYSSLLGDRQETVLSQELFDPPTGLFSDFSEETNT
jgi:anti-sigma factor RsiW